MGVEIERKFLVRDDSWRVDEPGVRLRQGYLSQAVAPTVRVRIAGERGFLTVKGASSGAVRAEFQYEIPLGDAAEMLGLCAGRVVEKTRYRVAAGGKLWEVDVFEGANRGLVLAEIELATVAEVIELPRWAGSEVTGDSRYYNSYLAEHPFGSW